jgi:hypothetical protein
MVQNRQAIADGTYDVEEKLNWKWTDLGSEEQEKYAQRLSQLREEWKKEDAKNGADAPASGNDGGEDTPMKDEEDVEMPDEVEEAGNRA